MGCEGFAGLLAYFTDAPASSGAGENGGTTIVDGRPVATHLLVRAAAFPDAPAPKFGVVVDVPLGGAENERLRADAGVQVTRLMPWPGGDNAQPFFGRGVPPAAAPASAAPGGGAMPLTSVSILEFSDWSTNASGRVMASLRLSVGQIYSTLSAVDPAGPFSGQFFLLALLLIGALFFIIQAAALAVGLSLARSITGSVHELFVGTEQVRQGDFTHKIAVVAHDQLGELAESFNSMTASIEDLLRQAAEKKRLEEELRIAHEIQMSLLPHGPLRMPGLSVTSLCVPAREVGGDYYDFLPIDEHRIGVLIADVSGKGTSAALYMAELKGLMLSLSRIHESPRELLIVANHIIAEHLDARSFITMTYAIIDLNRRTMTYARAGHTPLIYLPGPAAAERQVRILAPDGLVLGLKIDQGEMFDRLLREETIPLHGGDLYVFFTDGITEAMNAGDDCFGEQRLAELVEAHGHLPSDELRERVLREISAFVGDAPQHDDMTMILLRIEDLAAPVEAAARVPVAEAAEIG
jgi:serine phosphatase RsbU (regulator of sigma subunit)